METVLGVILRRVHLAQENHHLLTLAALHLIEGRNVGQLQPRGFAANLAGEVTICEQPRLALLQKAEVHVRRRRG